MATSQSRSCLMALVPKFDAELPNETLGSRKLREALDEAWSAYERAAARSGETVTDIDVAGSRIRLKFAGPVLIEPIISAIDHRRIPVAGAADITIGLFDRDSTGIAPLVADTLVTPDALERAVTRFSDKGLHLVYQHGTLPLLQTFDAARGRALFWINDAAELPIWDRCKPLRLVLHWAFAGGPWQPIHAGAVCGPHGGVLIGGRAGVGKSTAALSCVRAGWRYAGDDYVLITTDPVPRAENMFNSARLWDDMLLRFPELKPTVLNPEGTSSGEKADLRLAERLARQDLGGFPVRAILLPKVTGSLDSKTVQVSAARAMKAMAPSTLLTLYGESSNAFRRISEFVSAVPSFRLELGTDIDRIPRAIDDMLMSLPQ